MQKQLFFLLFIILTTMLSLQAHAQVVIIAHPSVKTINFSKANLRDLFTGASSSLPGDAHVAPVLLKSGPVNDEFLNLFIGKSDSAFRASWRSLLFSGQAVMPKTLDTEDDVVAYVARTPGAIGYIGKTAPHPGVKTLDIR